VKGIVKYYPANQEGEALLITECREAFPARVDHWQPIVDRAKQLVDTIKVNVESILEETRKVSSRRKPLRNWMSILP
jgi:hypothetical protein